MPTYGLYGVGYDGYFNDNPNWFAGRYGGSEIRTNFNRYTFEESPPEDSELETGGVSLQFTGYFTSSATGTHVFELGSDDAGYLWVGPTAETGFTVNNALVALPGTHGYYTSTGSISLTEGVPYFIRLQVGNQPAGYFNPGELSLGYKLPGQGQFTYDATVSNVYTLQQPSTPTPTPGSTPTPTPTPTATPTPTPTGTPTNTPPPPQGFFTRQNNQITTYTNLTAVFAAYGGSRAKTSITGLSSNGNDFKDLFDPALYPGEYIDFNTGFSVNGVDLKDIFRANGIIITPTPTPTSTPTGTPSPTNTPTPTPTNTPIPTNTPPPTQPPPPSPPYVSISINGSIAYGSSITFNSTGSSASQLINKHIIWERSGSTLSTIGVWVANYTTYPNAFISQLNNVGSFTFNYYGVYQFYAVIYTNNNIFAYGSNILTYYINP